MSSHFISILFLSFSLKLLTLVQTSTYTPKQDRRESHFPQRTIIIIMPATNTTKTPNATTPNNPFTLAHFKSYNETREVNGQKTAYGMATGRLKDIRKFLGTEIVLHHATIVYASSLVNVYTLKTCVDEKDENKSDEAADDGETSFIDNLGGNLKFDYLGSNRELASLFQKYKLELIC
jgi:hypothetical protein